MSYYFALKEILHILSTINSSLWIVYSKLFTITTYMAYRFSSLQQILSCFQDQQELSPSQIAYILGKSPVIIHKYLKELVLQKKLIKNKNWAHTTYSLAETQTIQNTGSNVRISLQDRDLWLSYSDLRILEETFYKFSENWVLLQWRKGFIERCNNRHLDADEKAPQFIKIKKHIDATKNVCGVIDATEAFSRHVEKLHMQKVFYADQYNRMEFGRWKLAEMTFFAKQSQNKSLISECISAITLSIECLIKKNKIDAIAIVPPSIARTNQLLKILRQELVYLWLPFVNIIKYFPWKIPVPQKSLKSRDQRIRNAQQTIIVDDSSTNKKWRILLIDDFVGSGSTLNETAHKLKKAWAQYVVWFAFVGNTNLSYEVINEV